MEISIIICQVLLFGHVIFFALAMAAILREDMRLLLSSQIDAEALSSTANAIKWLLLGLWVTGIPMVIMDIGTDLAVLLTKPKLLTKILVVTVLTVNGVLLHLLAFPMLTTVQRNPRFAATVAAILGAVSTSSWLFASFIGVARLIAPQFSLYDFISLYALAVMGGVSVALLFVRDRLERMLSPSEVLDRERDSEERDWATTLQEVETAITVLGVLHERMGLAQRAQIRSKREAMGEPITVMHANKRRNLA